VAREMGEDKMIGNVGIPPAALSVWQLGWIGPFLLVVSNVGYWTLLNRFLRTGSRLGQSIALYAIGAPYLVTLFPAPDTVLLLGQRAAAFWVGFWIVRKIASAFRGRDQFPSALRSGIGLTG